MKESIDRFAEWTEKNNTQITITTTGIAKKIADAFPFFYTTTRFAPVALRAEQQLQENSRMQCHHHLIPEQNHNELLARQEMNDRVHVIWLKDEDAYVRNHVRMTLTEKVLKDR